MHLTHYNFLFQNDLLTKQRVKKHHKLVPPSACHHHLLVNNSRQVKFWLFQSLMNSFMGSFSCCHCSDTMIEYNFWTMPMGAFHKGHHLSLSVAGLSLPEQCCSAQTRKLLLQRESQSWSFRTTVWKKNHKSKCIIKWHAPISLQN